MKERDNDAEKKRDRSMWIITVLAGMASYLDAGLIVSIGISLALWETHYQATALVIGSVSAVSTACIAIGALIGGRLADIFGRTRVFSITVFMYSVGVFCIVFAESISFLFVGIIISGISAGADLPTSLSIISERAPKGKQGKFIAFTQVMWSVGILGVTAIGFAVASLGVYGLKILWLHLAVLGTLTWLLRCFYKPIREIEKQLPVEKEPDNASDLGYRALFASGFLVPLLLIGGYYIFENITANTTGQFKFYLLTKVSGASQEMATGISFPMIVIGLLCAIIFSRIADTPWRNRMYFTGLAGQIIAISVMAITGAQNATIMFVCLFIYGISVPFSGEAIYKVWIQESFPVNIRATVQGMTYAVSRFVVALISLFSPAIINYSPSLLIWLLVAVTATGGIFALLIISRFKGINFKRTENTSMAVK